MALPWASLTVRDLDLSWGVSGPQAGMLLADRGADVTTIEPPGTDPWRNFLRLSLTPTLPGDPHRTPVHPEEAAKLIDARAADPSAASRKEQTWLT